MLQLARRDAELIDVGKRAGSEQTAQARIHAILLEHARAGRRVVRLKGGDPFVFGRGGEELEFLRAHGIRFEAVPGITAALACASYAGIPSTHRGLSRSLRLLTARDAEGEVQFDWASLARDGQTLAVYMFANDPDRAERVRTQVEAAPLPVKIRYLVEYMKETVKGKG